VVGGAGDYAGGGDVHGGCLKGVRGQG
jgi:hypothetical protein